MKLYKISGKMSDLVSRDPKPGDFVRAEGEPLRRLEIVSEYPLLFSVHEAFLGVATICGDDDIVEFSRQCEQFSYYNRYNECFDLDLNRIEDTLSWTNENLSTIRLQKPVDSMFLF